MDLGPRYSWRDELAAAARTAFGPGCRVVRTERLRDASKKGVYRLVLGDGASAIGYVWDETENFWPTRAEPGPDRTDPFSDASGADLFEASHGLLDALGIRVPAVYLLDRSRTACQADIALVEDVRGGTLETLMSSGLPGARAALAQLAASLDAMHRHRSPRFGKIAAASSLTAGDSRSSEQVVLDRALGDLADAARRVERVAAARGRLEDVVRELAAAVRPRAQYGLIHGELGPDHVLIDDRNQPVLIDIEGLMFFDIEWEHAFLQLRFKDYYRWLRVSDLDERRLRFYRLALHLSLIAGPLRLLDGDFPDREPMQQIADFNTDRVLRYLG